MAYKVDLHNHSCLSPCGSLELSPLRLVREAKAQNIDILGLTDHNAIDNLPAFKICCQNEGITPIFGIEVTSREEAHMLCLFEHLKEAMHFGYKMYESLDSLTLDPEVNGDQVIVDEQENILGFLDKHLASGAVEYSIEELLDLTHRANGLFIPAHIDRPAFSIGSQLGFLPDNNYDALEVKQSPCSLNWGKWKELHGSDCHYPENCGDSPSILPLKQKSFQSLKEYLKQN